jgi:hypothetical protein
MFLLIFEKQIQVIFIILLHKVTIHEVSVLSANLKGPILFAFLCRYQYYQYSKKQKNIAITNQNIIFRNEKDYMVWLRVINQHQAQLQ